jgi:hypothetical protein
MSTILQQFYSAQSVESSILLADNDDSLYGDLYDVRIWFASLFLVFYVDNILFYK